MRNAKPQTNQGENREPFFIVGCPRSGTTLLQVMLDAHPHLTIPPESHVFSRFSDLVPFYGDLEQPSNLQYFVADLLSDARIVEWGLPTNVATFCQGLETHTAAGVFRHLFGIYAQREGKKRWGEKTPQHVFQLPFIARLFPQAKVIHVLRDGRDVAESMRRAYFGPYSILALARRWAASVRAFEAFAASYDDELTLQVHYEDMVQRCDHVLQRVLRFLEEPGKANVEGFPVTALRSFYVGHHPAHATLHQDLVKNRVGRYRSCLTRREIVLFENIAGEILSSYGYRLENNPEKRVCTRSAERLRYMLQDTVWRYVRKLHRPRVVRLDLRYALQDWCRRSAHGIRRGTWFPTSHGEGN